MGAQDVVIYRSVGGSGCGDRKMRIRLTEQELAKAYEAYAFSLNKEIARGELLGLIEIMKPKNVSDEYIDEMASRTAKILTERQMQDTSYARKSARQILVNSIYGRDSKESK